MDREIAFEISSPMIKRLVLWNIWRIAGFWILILVPVFVASAYFLIAHESRSVWAYVGIVIPVVYWCKWARFFSQSVARLLDPKDRRVRLKVADDSLTFEAENESAILRWPAINHVWRKEDCLILGGGKPDWLRPIPLDPVGDDVFDYIIEKARSEGDLRGPVR